MITNSTAVLIHGCHLQADLEGKSWEDIVLGLKDGKPTLAGRAIMGVNIALKENASLIIFSTGASQCDGLKEGEYTYHEVRRRARDLEDLIGVPKDTLADWLKVHHQLDLVSQNTAEECARNFRIASDMGVMRVIIVSSPWHIQRCHTEALKAAEAMRATGRRVPEILAMASHGPTEGVVIVEPPHRGDMPKVPFHKTIARVFPLFRNPETAIKINDAVGRVIDTYSNPMTK